MVEALATMTQELGKLQLNTEDFLRVVIDYMLQMAEQNEETQETAAPTGDASLASTYSRRIRHSQYTEFECLTEERELTSITDSSMFN